MKRHHQQLIKDVEKCNEEVTLPQCRQKYKVGDFLINNGDLKLVLENAIVRVVLKSRRREVFNEAHKGVMAGHLKGRILGRPTVHGDEDTAPPGLFFCCPGEHEMRGSAAYSFSCTERKKPSLSSHTVATTCFVVLLVTTAPFFDGSVASAARNGVKTITVAPPRGDAAYQQNRMEINEMIGLARKTVTMMKQNLVSLFPQLRQDENHRTDHQHIHELTRQIPTR
ncbi:hypothetical protein ANCDUO_07624 [Ancylostoma duodenale]|uniref:Uncharacterized protein n=1 Tax=Ancylostoma duodenale TaxID=51022 RepID=A0A0C2DI00_9BILA|nr:hypothetical protein ANCDUO_07624 [Ancylostoma duodenale]